MVFKNCKYDNIFTKKDTQKIAKISYLKNFKDNINITIKKIIIILQALKTLNFSSTLF